uniref:F-box domain-containing protein n=1 Tax=Caenorhabditis tropicalis TaxID=1561998 RepID=A0A1I7TH69_9PELO
MTTFPLLQLPIVAMENVLYMTNPNVLFNFSLASTRAKKIVKNFTSTKIIPTEMKMNRECPTILIIWKHERWSYTWTTDESKIGYKESPGFYRITKLAENPVQELLKWYNYAKEVLNCFISFLVINVGYFPNYNRSIADLLDSQQNTITDLIVKGQGEQGSEDIKYFLSNIKFCERLFVYMQHYGDNFQVEIPEGRKLDVLDAKFIKYEQFSRLKHEEIILDGSILTYQELNRFLKSWIACETHLELESLKINVRYPDAMELLMNIPHEETTDRNIMEKFRENRFDANVTKGFDITRCDGRMATVCLVEKWNKWRLCLLIH